jgi:uncharacterized protein
VIGLLTLHLSLPGCSSLKEKRGRLQPLLHRLHREFNITVAEMDLHDKWQEAVVTCGLVGNDRVHLEQSLQVVLHWVENHWTDLTVLDETFEFI